MSDLCKEIALMGKAIGNQNRYRILEALMKSPLAVGEVAQKVGLPQPAVSQHLKVLKSAHLVDCERQGQEVLYSVNVAYMAALIKKLATDLPSNKTKVQV